MKICTLKNQSRMVDASGESVVLLFLLLVLLNILVALARARMPLGESRFDVVSRVSRVIDQILLDEHYMGIRDVVIVSHGITLRAFAMAWLERTAEWMEREPNPLNASVRLIEGRVDKGYIFKGFKGDERIKADKEEDLVEGVVQRSKTMMAKNDSTEVRRERLEERMRTMQEEMEEIKEELRNLKKDEELKK